MRSICSIKENLFLLLFYFIYQIDFFSMADTTKNIDLTIERQIHLLTDLRNDLRVLLGAHPNGVWFQMLPKAFHMHFNRDLQLTSMDVCDPLLLLDCISDIVKFDLPENGDNEDFVIELVVNDSSKIKSVSMRSTDLHKRRDTLMNMLRDPNTGGRGSLLRQICSIDEQLKQIKDEPQSTTNSSPPPAPPPLLLMPVTPPPLTQEQVAVRLQKIRSMIDVCLRHLFKFPDQISGGELAALYDQCERFMVNLTPFAQHYSSTPVASPSQ